VIAIRWVVVALVAGLAAGTLVLVARQANAAAPPSPLEIRSACADEMRVLLGVRNREVRTLTLREPGLYRVEDLTRTDVSWIAIAAGRRSLEEIPVGSEGEIMLPTSWCPVGTALTLTGVGLQP
jgi:hypothetical protein